VIVEPHRIEGVYVVKGKEDALATHNLVPGESTYGEKRVAIKPTIPYGLAPIDGKPPAQPIEYRVWNPFRSKLAAAIMVGVGDTHIKPGTKVLYLGAASGTTVSHVSDIVGEGGVVYAVEFSHRSGRDLLNTAKKRSNVVPVIEDARHPYKYGMLVGMVDVIFSDVAQPDQSRIVIQNAQKYLKSNGYVVMSIKANCVDSTAEPEVIYAGEVNKLREEKFKPIEQVTLEPYERDHAVIVAEYRPTSKKVKKKKAEPTEQATQEPQVAVTSIAPPQVAVTAESCPVAKKKKKTKVEPMET